MIFQDDGILPKTNTMTRAQYSLLGQYLPQGDSVLPGERWVDRKVKSVFKTPACERFIRASHQPNPLTLSAVTNSWGILRKW